MSSKIDYTDIRDDRIRSEICDIMSEMLDNPLECGLYRTSKFMWKMETFILAEADAQAAEIERLQAEIEDLNESLTIAHMDGAYEGRKSKESEIKRQQETLQKIYGIIFSKGFTMGEKIVYCKQALKGKNDE